MKGKEQYFIYQEINNKTSPFATWLDEEFWMRWFQMEIEERENTLQNVEDFYFSVISEIATIMNNLKIELKVTLYCMIDKIAKSFIVNDKILITDLEKTIRKQHSFFTKNWDSEDS